MISQNQPVAFNVALAGVLSTGVALAALLIPGLEGNVGLQSAIIAFGNAVILLVTILRTTAQVTPVANPSLPSGTSVKVQGTEDSVIIGPTPPGPVGVDGPPILTAADAAADLAGTPRPDNPTPGP